MGERPTPDQRASTASAKALLGPRARAYREAGFWVIARDEITQEGTRYKRVYGRAGSLAEALAAAAASYADMRRHPERTT